MEQKRYTFHNVTIAFDSKNGEAAYTALCNALFTLKNAYWETDTFSVGYSETKQPTSNVWPK